MIGVVLDASAAVEIALGTPRGLRLASHLPTEGEVMTPDHFFAEAGGALRRMENHGDLSTDRATLALRRVRSLRVQRVSTLGACYLLPGTCAVTSPSGTGSTWPWPGVSTWRS